MEEKSREASRSIGHTSNNLQPQTRRSVGKLMSRPQFLEQRQMLGTSKIKIEEDSESGSQMSQINCENKSIEAVPLQSNLDKEAKKSE